MKKKIESLLVEEKILMPTVYAQAEFSRSLSKFEWYLYFYALYKLLNKKENTNEVEFNLSEFCKDVGVEISNYYYFWKYNVENLQTVLLKGTEYKTHNLVKVNLIYKTIFDEQNRKLKIYFVPEMVDNFKNCRNKFTFPELKNILSFSSKYSIRMYLYTKSLYHPLNYKNYQELPISQIKKIFGLNNDKYSLIANIKDRIINPITEDFKFNNSEFNLSYEDIKEGKKIVAFKFHIIPKQKPLPKPDNQNINLNLRNDIFFKQLFQRNYTEKENEILEPYLINVNNDVINYLTYQISLKQKHFSINYLAKILDECLTKKIANNLSAVKEKYQDVFKK